MNDEVSRLCRHRDLEGEIPNGEAHESLWSHIRQVGKKYFLHIIATNKCSLPSSVVRACNPTWGRLRASLGSLRLSVRKGYPNPDSCGDDSFYQSCCGLYPWLYLHPIGCVPHRPTTIAPI
jgi:hypothetical protein